jgi:hypothetical protein
LELSEKKEKIEYYLKSYFDDWLINDLKIIIEIIEKGNKEFTLPPILLISSGIDFLGGLQFGFLKNNSAKRSRNFIKLWMKRINSKYAINNLNKFIYDIIRCGSFHQAIYKKGVQISSDKFTKHHHLNLIDPSNDIFINTIQFANDFIEAQKLFREEHIKDNIETVYNNLISVYKTNNYPDLRTSLRTKNFIVNEKIFVATSSAPPEINIRGPFK